MKKVILILLAELLLSGFFAFLFNDYIIDYNFFTNLGSGNLIIGFVSGVIGLIALSFDKENGKKILSAAGLLLLLGGLTCSFFPLQFNGHH